MVDMTFIRSH